MSEEVLYLFLEEFCTLILKEYHESLSYINIYYPTYHEFLGGDYQP